MNLTDWSGAVVMYNKHLQNSHTEQVDFEKMQGLIIPERGENSEMLAIQNLCDLFVFQMKVFDKNQFNLLVS